MEFHACHVAVAPIEVVLTCLRIAEHVGVYFLSPRLALGMTFDEGLAQRVAERTFGTVGDGHTDLFVGRIVVVILIIRASFLSFAFGVGALYDAGCPGVVVGPREVGAEIEYGALIAPVFEVGAREGLEEVAAPSVEAVGGGIDVVAVGLVGIHHFGVGIVAAKCGIVLVVEGDVVAVHAFGGHLHAFHGAVLAIVEVVGTYAATVAAAFALERAVVVEEYPLSAKLCNGGVYGVAVAGGFGEESFVFKRSVGLVGHGVGEFFGETGGVGEVVLAAALVNPGGFFVLAAGYVNALYFALGFNHVFLELHAVAEAVAPVEPSLAVVVDEDGGVYAHPGVGGALTVGGGYEGVTDGIVEGTFGTVSNGHTDAAAVGAHVEVVLAVALYGLCGVGCSVAVPLEVFNAKRGGIFGPMGEVGGGVDFPIFEFVAFLVSGIVVTGIEPKGVALDHGGRVASVFVGDDGIAVGLEVANGVGLCRTLCANRKRECKTKCTGKEKRGEGFPCCHGEGYCG